MSDIENPTIKQAFAATLRTMRHERGYSQEELADRTGVSMRFVSFMETGKRQPTISTLDALARALGVSFSEFCSAIDTKRAALER